MKIRQFTLRLSIALITFIIGVSAEMIFLNNVFPKLPDAARPAGVLNVEAIDEEPFWETIHSTESDEDYAVYSAVLNDENYRDETVVISSFTSNETINDSFDDTDFLEVEFSDSTKDTVSDFKTKNKAKQKLGNFFTFGGKVFFLTQNEEKWMFVNPDGWNKFSQKYPGAKKLIKFSAVGFNRTRTQAIVYISVNCVVSCSYSNFIFLKKKDGKWILYQDVNLWIS
jgi:hypothetical protein